jgi:Ca2+-binding RTX toxin-like protein
VTADGDTTIDVYERSAGQTTLVSTGPNGSALPARFEGASADGARIFFNTSERLVNTDTDFFPDVYERAGGQTTLISIGPSSGGIGDLFADLVRVSQDGTRAFFITNERLVTGDGDTSPDVYERSGGQTTLVSTGLPSPLPVIFVGASADGTRVFFSTEAKLVSADTDTVRDLYERSGGQTTLVSAGLNLPQAAFFSGASVDGTRVFFTTAEPLVGDTDTTPDVYERSGGQTTLISTGPTGGANVQAFFGGSSAGGIRVFFTTAEKLVSADTDAATDVYERSGGQTTLISTGNQTTDALFRGMSADGTRVFFTTAEPLVNDDTDAAVDVYERSGEQTTLISSGPAGGNGAFDAVFKGASTDGSRVYLATAESLASTDTDTFEDLYVKRVEAPVRTARPTISGTSLVGRVLSCSPGSWDHNPTRFAYRWNRGGVAINGATSPDYTLTSADGARSITCTVTASNSAGSSSAMSAPVTPRFPGACANIQTGGAGPDRLTGLDLGDVLRGLGGNDVLVGLAGDDCLSGGAGNDTLRGDAGLDRFDGGAGNDAINSRDGRRETVTCGTGRQDRVTADRGDRLIGCEIVRRP